MDTADIMTTAPAVAETRDRVRAHTPSQVNHKIDQATMKRIWYYASQRRDVITRRINELDHEWDVERMVEVTYASTSLAGLALGIAGNRRWLVVPALMMACMLHHASSGSAPTVYFFRRMGIRTRREIDGEKYALKMLRGDFDAIHTASESTHRAIEALRLSRL